MALAPFWTAYAPGTVFSSIDRQGRYAYANQPLILGWNLARLAEALLPFIDADEARAVDKATVRLEAIAGLYRREWLDVMRAKLGLLGQEAGDEALIDDLMPALLGRDWTLTFRRGFAGLGPWRDRWLARVGEGWQARLAAANPAVIPRNHRVEEALDAAVAGNLAPFEALLAALRDPFGPETGREGFALPPPEGLAPHVTYCGT